MCVGSTSQMSRRENAQDRSFEKSSSFSVTAYTAKSNAKVVHEVHAHVHVHVKPYYTTSVASRQRLDMTSILACGT